MSEQLERSEEPSLFEPSVRKFGAEALVAEAFIFADNFH